MNYYSYGMAQPSRTFAGSRSWWGYNGKEKEDDWEGDAGVAVTGGSYDYGFRMYDARVGRFVSEDPLYIKYPSIAPYAFAGNSAIALTDRGGDSVVPYLGDLRGGLAGAPVTAYRIATLQRIYERYKDVSPAVKWAFETKNVRIYVHCNNMFLDQFIAGEWMGRPYSNARIDWDPHGGVLWATAGRDRRLTGRAGSPAQGLLHELIHAYTYYRDPLGLFAKYRRLGDPDDPLRSRAASEDRAWLVNSFLEYFFDSKAYNSNLGSPWEVYVMDLERQVDEQLGDDFRAWSYTGDNVYVKDILDFPSTDKKRSDGEDGQ